RISRTAALLRSGIVVIGVEDGSRRIQDAQIRIGDNRTAMADLQVYRMFQRQFIENVMGRFATKIYELNKWDLYNLLETS
ncbi:hypothetical protein, partial [Bacteroides bouchesdurhonensis]|uniref:hypothetical protein n=1 Tax=Bacteroides bouchesdurhonensis TaxID=1841855 RepID=UPI0022E62135